MKKMSQKGQTYIKCLLDCWKKIQHLWNNVNSFVANCFLSWAVLAMAFIHVNSIAEIWPTKFFFSVPTSLSSAISLKGDGGHITFLPSLTQRRERRTWLFFPPKNLIMEVSRKKRRNAVTGISFAVLERCGFSIRTTHHMFKTWCKNSSKIENNLKFFKKKNSKKQLFKIAVNWKGRNLIKTINIEFMEKTYALDLLDTLH